MIEHIVGVLWALCLLVGYPLLFFMSRRRISTWRELWVALTRKPLPRAKARRKKRR